MTTTAGSTPTDVGRILARAHALVEHAREAADRGTGLEDMTLAMRCVEVAYLLTDAGAVPDADQLSEAPSGTPGDLLAAAGEVLDGIAEADRPTLVLQARAALSTAQFLAGE